MSYYKYPTTTRYKVFYISYKQTKFFSEILEEAQHNIELVKKLKKFEAIAIAFNKAFEKDQYQYCDLLHSKLVSIGKELGYDGEQIEDMIYDIRDNY